VALCNAADADRVAGAYLTSNVSNRKASLKEAFVKRLSQMLLIVACLLVAAAQAEKVQKGPVVIKEIKHDVSLPLRDMAKLTPVPKHANREIDNHPPGVVPRQIGAPGVDAAVETGHLP